MALVEQTEQRSRWSIRRTLRILEISPSSYYRWRQQTAWDRPTARAPTGSLYELLEAERRAIRAYALKHPAVRHRELAWRMLDEGVCGVSPSSVYRVLREADLVCRWTPKTKAGSTGREASPTRPDQKWQTDIKYVRVGPRNYYLLSFLDVYSQYIVHHELLAWMGGLSVATEAAAALETLDGDVRPDIQSDHGSGFVSREFAETLRAAGVTHKKIRPHTPTDNAEIERCQRTIGERLDGHELEDLVQARAVIAEIIDDYNHVRLRSSDAYTGWLHSNVRNLTDTTFGVVVPAAGGLLSRESGGVAGRASPDVENGQGAAQAGEHQAAAASPALGGGGNRHLSEAANCLTLIETNQSYSTRLRAASTVRVRPTR